MTTTAAYETDEGSVLRLLPAPQSEPPYDDERETAPAYETVHAVQGALALAFELPGGLPAVPAAALQLVRSADGEAEPDFFAPQRTPTTALPDPRLFAARLVQAMLEVVVAARPLAQLIRWTTEEVYRQLGRQVRIAGHEDASRRRRLVPGRVRSIHISEPRGHAVEVCAIVQHRERTTAMALRLEGVDGRWQCTALQVG
jgi:hypothetical protein